MTEWLGLPALASAHGGQIDNMIGWVHVFMLILFVPRMGFGLVRTEHPGLQILRGVLLVSSTAMFYLSLKFLPLAEAARCVFVVRAGVQLPARMGAVWLDADVPGAQPERVAWIAYPLPEGEKVWHCEPPPEMPGLPGRK